MANAASTQEPTMEEILASIRRIISEDGEEAKPAPEPQEPKSAPIAAKAQPTPAPKPSEDDVLELTDVVPEEGAEEAVIDDDVVMVERAPAKPAPAPKVEMRAPAKPAPARQERSLLSESAREQASTSFMQLDRKALISEESDPRSLEALVQEMLRPVLESWLNENLPDIVERLVQQEIDRVSRKGR